MSNKRAFIGVGHGGNDPGAVANGLKEAHINLTVALEVDCILKAHNVTTQLSRYKEENDDLAEEIREANAFKPDVAVDVHVNAGGGDGFEAFYSIDQNYTKGVDKALAANIEAEVKAIGQNSRGLKTKKNDQGRDYFGFIRSVNCPSVIIEMAFIDNVNDIRDFDEVNEQKRYALAVAKGILKTLGIAYKESSTSVSPKPESTSFKSGDKVKVSSSATHYATGQSIASFVKGSTYTVKEAKSDRVLLSEITSWMFNKDVSLVSSVSSSYTVKVATDVLNVRTGPSTDYKVATTVKRGEVYTIVETKSGWGKLKSGAGWISLEYTAKC